MHLLKLKTHFFSATLAMGLSCLFFSCQQKKTESSEFKDVTRRTIEVKLDDTTSKFPSEVMQSIDYIPLETTRESQFSQVSKLELLDKYFVIFDKTSNAIYFFLKDGKFSHKISNQGLDPEKSFKNISNFFIDRENQRIVIRDNKRLKLIYYNYEGKKTNEKDWPFDLKDFNSLGKSQFFYMAYLKEVDSSYLVNKDHFFKNLLIGDTTFKIEKSYFKYNPHVTYPSDLYNVNNVFYTTGSSMSFCDPYQYDIAKFSNGSEPKPEKIFHVAFDQDNKLPDDYLYSISLKDNRRNYLRTNPNKIWACTEVYTPNNEMLIFNLSSIKKLHNIFVYDLKSNRYFRLENLYSTDKLSYMLPLYGLGIDGADDQFVYSDITSDHMYKALNLVGKSKHINENPALKKFFEESNNLSNPVITRIKFKPF